MNRSVVIDCDPGVDDALALFMALASNEWEIKGITAVAGNVPVPQTAENARRIVALADRNIPVVVGAPKPLERQLKIAAHVHGSNGLGNVVLPVSTNPFCQTPVEEFIYQEAQKAAGTLELITLGPLTNIAQTFLKYPDLPSMIKKIWTMGGAAEGGNVSPCAEYNIHADPEAAQIVFRAGIPLVMCGLDVTRQAVIYKEDLDQLGKMQSEVSGWMMVMLESYVDFYRKSGRRGAAMHDPLAVACAIDPTLVVTEELPVDVETKGEFTTGCTVVDRNGTSQRSANVEVAMELEPERFVELLMELMFSYDS